MPDDLSTDRYVFPLAVGCRIFWAEPIDNGMQLVEMDCVADDFGNLVGVPRRDEKVGKKAQGWFYRATQSEAAA